jgi:hypothetical protein
MHRLAALLGLVAALGASGCGGSPAVDSIPGARVATMADHQLEAMHSELAPGTMSCPRLDFTVDAAVRCTRVSELENGVRVEVRGTVTVTSTRDGGKLHVQMDKNNTKVWVTSAQLEGDLRDRASKLVGVTPDKVTCPQLTSGNGFTGRTVCTVLFGTTALQAEATYAGTGAQLPPASAALPYRFAARVFTPELNPGLPSLLRAIRRDGLAS